MIEPLKMFFCTMYEHLYLSTIFNPVLGLVNVVKIIWIDIINMTFHTFQYGNLFSQRKLMFCHEQGTETNPLINKM